MVVNWSDDLKMVIEDFPTETIVESVVGESYVAEPLDLKAVRNQEIVYELTAKLLNRYFRSDDGTAQYWLFPKLRPIVEDYVGNMVVLRDNMFIGLLRLSQYANEAVSNIHRAIARGIPKKRLLPILAQYDRVGSTRFVDFTTTKECTETSKSHVSHVVEDSDWERQVQKKLEEMDEVLCYVKNQGLDFYVPYDNGGITRRYLPDFIVKLRRN